MRPAFLAKLQAMTSAYEMIVERKSHLLRQAKDNPSAGYLLFCPEDKTIFLARRAKDMKSPGTWDIPGGRYDDSDDSVEETAAREVYEEVGEVPKKKKLLGKHTLEKEKRNYVIYIYSVPASEKKQWKPDLSDESDAYKWFKVTNLPKELHLDMSWVESAVA